MSRKNYKHLYNAFEAGTEEVAQLDQAIRAVTKAAYSKDHYESDLKGHIDLLVNAVQLSWHKLVTLPFFAEKANQPPEAVSLHRKVKLTTPEKIFDAYEKVAATDARSSGVTAMYLFLQEAASIAQLATYATKAAIKGNRPHLLESGYGTCPCCFNVQGIKSERMVNHGYTKPDRWSRSAACQGVGEPPLEISTVGLEKMLERTKVWIKERQDELADSSAIKSVWVPGRGEVKPEAPEFQREKTSYLKQLPGEIDRAIADLAVAEQKLVEWTPASKEEPVMRR